MTFFEALKQLRDDIKTWVTVNIRALNAKIDEKTISIDNKLNTTSTNPVQNKVITDAINNIPRFSGDYYDLTNAPNIFEDNLYNMAITDDAGHIILNVDSSGLETATINAQALVVNGIDIENELDSKVEKVAGKALSTNDFTNEYKEKLDNLNNTEGGITVEEDPTVPAWAKEPTKPSYTADEVGALPKNTLLFSGDYNDLTNAPDINEDNSGDLIVADENGNIIFRSNGDGFETVNLIVQNITLDGKTIQAVIQEYVDETILGGEW